jgi:endoglycosylceramidase
MSKNFSLGFLSMKIFLLLILFPALTWSKFPTDLSFQSDPRANQISVKFKEFKGMRDWVFVDGLGREVSLRGMSMSLKSKSRRNNFSAFSSLPQAQMEIGRFKGYLGGNLIRWLFNWGTIVPSPGIINFKYLDSQIAQIKLAVQYGIHILIYINQDLMGIQSNGKYLGENGPPAWIYDALKLPPGSCGKICVSKSQNYVTNKRVRAAFNRFWNNASFETPIGKKYFQDEYFFMMLSVMKYLKDKLTPFEWFFIVGVDPIGEPVPGDYENKEGYPEWTYNKLFPFYEKVRISLNTQAMADKLVFADSSYFWSNRIPLAFNLIRPLVPLSLTRPIGQGFVFNANRFDEARDSLGLKGGQNGIFLGPMDFVRNEARKMAAPSFLPTYGLWNMEKRKNYIDPQQLFKADYQAIELSLPPEKFANFYSPLISGTQWVWDLVGYNTFYFGHGVSRNKGHYEELGYRAIERAYPRRIDGDLMHFYYNDGAKNLSKLEEMAWVGIKTEEQNDSNDKKALFSQNKFVFMVSRGKLSPAPSEIFLPRNFDISKTVVLTDEGVFEKPKVFPDFPQGGNQLFISSENKSPYHFTFILEKGSNDNLSSKELEELRQKIAERVNQEKSPLFFVEKMQLSPANFRN